MKQWMPGFLLFVIIVLISSCSLTDNDKPVAAFLTVSNPKVIAPDGTGYDTHKITDIWVFVNGQIIGVFPLPATRIPVTIVGNGEVDITFLAGIRNNGMQDTPVFYPFYESIEKSIRLTAGETYDMPLEFSYVSNTKFGVSEGFETGNSLSFNIDNNDASNITISSEQASLGTKSGLASLTSSLRNFEIASQNGIRKGENAGGSSYIEMDYKGEGEIAIGIAKTQGAVFQIEYVLFVPGKQDWNKIYIDVTDKLSPNDFDEYRIAFAFSKTGLSATSKIFIDNIKHVHF